MARPAGDLLLAGRKDARTRKLCIDLPHEHDHLPRHLFLGFHVGRKIALHVAMRALHTKSLVEALHHEPDVGFRIQQFQVLRWWQWSPSALAAAPFLSERRNGQQEKQNNE